MIEERPTGDMRLKFCRIVSVLALLAGMTAALFGLVLMQTAYSLDSPEAIEEARKMVLIAGPGCGLLGLAACGVGVLSGRGFKVGNGYRGMQALGGGLSLVAVILGTWLWLTISSRVL